MTLLFTISGHFCHMSPYDLATLEPSFEYLTNDHLNCHKSIASLAKHYGLEKATEIVQKNHKCNELSVEPVGETEIFTYHQCICKTYSPRILLYLKMLDAYKNGIMPHSGGFLDQSAPLMETLSFVGNLVSAYQEKEAKKKNKRKGK